MQKTKIQKNKEFEKYFKNQIKQIFPSHLKTQNLLKKACLYSLLAPSSHFRSLLAIETTKYLKQKSQKIFPWAMAIEMFHTGSLIHDDLPAMDDGKTRRGQKCNHLVFGESISLLAGSCLFVESFSLLKDHVFKKKESLILDLFISKVGFKGLMSGQLFDLTFKNPSSKEILKMIQLKTGSLIEAAVEAPLLLWAKNKKSKVALKNFAKHLGIAYQLADDLQDKDSLFEKQKSKEILRLQTKKSLQALNILKKEAPALKALVLWNEKRANKKT